MLTDLKGNKIDTPLNPVTRTFTLKADPTEQRKLYQNQKEINILCILYLTHFQAHRSIKGEKNKKK